MQENIGTKVWRPEKDVFASIGQYYLGRHRQNYCLYAQEWLAGNFKDLFKVFNTRSCRVVTSEIYRGCCSHQLDAILMFPCKRGRGQMLVIVLAGLYTEVLS